MYDECSLMVSVPVEQANESLIEVLQEMLVVKQSILEQMRRYHLDTARVERDVEHVQGEIERLLMK